jgi:hypothetical protein
MKWKTNKLKSYIIEPFIKVTECKKLNIAQITNIPVLAFLSDK